MILIKSIPRRLADLVKKVWEHRLFAVLGILVLSAIGIVIYWAIRPTNIPVWTGLTERRYLVQENEVVVPAKTLWDFLGIVLAVLAGLVIAVLNQRNANRRARVEREIALGNQHQTTLETYFDRMTELILDNGLGKKKAKKGVESIARTRTLAVLRSLDAGRVSAVFRFIDDAELQDVISLTEGNLGGVNWSGADLGRVDLSGVDLNGATLGALLFEADLIGANLLDL